MKVLQSTPPAISLDWMIVISHFLPPHGWRKKLTIKGKFIQVKVLSLTAQNLSWNISNLYVETVGLRFSELPTQSAFYSSFRLPSNGVKMLSGLRCTPEQYIQVRYRNGTRTQTDGNLESQRCMGPMVRMWSCWISSHYLGMKKGMGKRWS